MTSLNEQEKHRRIVPVPDFYDQFTLLRNYGNKIQWDKKGKGYLVFIGELTKGESRLSVLDNVRAAKLGYKEGLLRESNISCVYVYHQSDSQKRLQLFETLQVFKSGFRLHRGYRWVSEKSQFGESPKDTAVRALTEELGLGDNQNPINPERLLFFRQIIKNDTADTYPGLQSRMTATDFGIELTAHEYNTHKIILPDGEETFGFKEDQEDKITYFTWQEI